MNERSVQSISDDARQLGLSDAKFMTLRQYIAIQALQGILAKSHNDSSYEGAARDAAQHADSLLEELVK